MDKTEYISVICQKCLSSRTGDKLGDACKTPGCDGVLTKVPEFSTLVDNEAASFCCGSRRSQTGVTDKLDYWQKFKSNGDRVCSYCGSLHFDDFRKLVLDATDDNSTISIEPSDKDYKVYVIRAGVRNAYEGGIKFYMWHAVHPVSDEDNKLYTAAIKLSRKRFEDRMYQRRQEMSKSLPDGGKTNDA